MDIFGQKNKASNELINSIPIAFSKVKVEYSEEGKPVDLIFLEINDAFSKIALKDSEDIIGKRLSEISAEYKEKLPEAFEANSDKINNQSNFEIEVYISNQNKWYDVYINILDRDNLTILLSDCSKRKFIEKELIESEKKFKNLYNRTINNIKINKIAENQISELSNLYLELGVDPLKNIHTIVKKTNEILKGACSLFNRLDDKTKSLITWSEYNAPADLYKEDIPDGHICYEATIKGKDKTIVINDLLNTDFHKTDSNVIKYGLRSYLGHPVIIDDKAIGALCMVDTQPRNFTETEINIIRTLTVALSLEQKRYNLENNLRSARSDAEQANQAKSQFLANMSHEIRTPLNGILGFSEMLSISETDNYKVRMLRMIEKAGNQLLQIVNDIFDYSKIEAGKISLEEEDFKLNELIKETVSFFDHTVKEKKLQIIVRTETIAENELFGDLFKLRQILVNIISNAIKFTDKGSIIIIAESKKSDEKIQTQIIIEDTGIGIEKEQLDKIFDEFKQLEYYLTKKIKGTGLGLAITKKLIDLLSGTIIVESEPGVGSRFILSIPFQPKSKIKIEEIMDKPIEKKEDYKKMIKILLAEDNEANQFLIKAITKSKDWDITVVDDGDKAVEEFEKNEFDLVLMDVQMPVMNGYEATRIIRDIEQREKRNHTPIIALTAYAMKSDKDLCIEAGMDDYISKPFKRQQFLDSIMDVINRND